MKHYPTVNKGGVVDDRNFRGPPQDVVEALRAIDTFDTCVGLINHPDKFAAIACNAGTARWLRAQTINKHKLHVLRKHKLVGTMISATTSVYRGLQNLRVKAAVNTLRAVAKANVWGELKEYAACAAGLTKALYGNIWAFPLYLPFAN